MTSIDPRHSLELLRPEVDDLNRNVAGLTAEQWERPSNCAGWQVADLVAHVIRNGWSMLTLVQRALADDSTPAFGPAAQQLQEEIKAAGPRAGAERQQRETAELIELVSGLSEAEMDKEGVHPQGKRPIRWACTQRLVEVAFHHWDLRHSLGHDGPMPAPLAEHVLPFMLDTRWPNIMTKMAEGAAGESFRLRSTGDGRVWRVTAADEGRRVEPDAGGSAGLEVAAEAGWLVLLLYGRVPLSEAHFQVSGPPEAVARFRACFGC